MRADHPRIAHHHIRSLPSFVHVRILVCDGSATEIICVQILSICAAVLVNP